MNFGSNSSSDESDSTEKYLFQRMDSNSKYVNRHREWQTLLCMVWYFFAKRRDSNNTQQYNICQHVRRAIEPIEENCIENRWWNWDFVRIHLLILSPNLIQARLAPPRARLALPRNSWGTPPTRNWETTTYLRPSPYPQAKLAPWEAPPSVSPTPRASVASHVLLIDIRLERGGMGVGR